MVFNKYKDKQFRNIVYPRDGYYYTYEYSKKIGWYYIKGGKKYDNKIIKEKE